MPASDPSFSRYQRQMLLPQIGRAGQQRLAEARVLLVGCGALGCTIAEQLVRAGVGHLRVVDRDIVELTNLQRQTLFDEADAREGLPKAIAAERRLRRINSEVEIEGVVADVHSGNVEAIADRIHHGGTEAGREDSEEGGEDKAEGGESATADLRSQISDPRFPLLRASVSPWLTTLCLDGTDNVQTRYLLNDYCVKHFIPWVYGGCVGMEGRVMAISPLATACLRCIYPDPPGPGELPTCDTAGVLGPAAAVTGALQAAAAIRLLVGGNSGGAVSPPADAKQQLLSFDVWTGRFIAIDTSSAKRADCPCCGARRFDFLDALPADTVSLCGANAVQVRPGRPAQLDLVSLAARLEGAGAVQLTRYLLRCRLSEPADLSLTIFPDARVVVSGTTDPARARAITARFVGG